MIARQDLRQSFRSSIAFHSKGRKKQTTFSRCCSGKGSEGREKRGHMYTGTLIDDLIKTVERAERCSQRLLSSEEKLAHFYQVAQFETTQFETRLAGVA
jgi:hypothetical protein